jgi:peroxiredoxin
VAHGCSVNAVAADPLDKAREVGEKVGGGVTTFSDPGLVVSALWGAGKAGEDEPTPATYVIAPGGAIRFEHHAGDGGDWPHVEDVLAALPAAR